MKSRSEARIVNGVVVNAVVEIKAYSVISNAVAEGVRYGLRRVWKYRDKPIGESDDIAETIERAVMDALSEVIEWGD